MFGVTCTCSWLELFVVIWSWVKNDAAPFLGVGGLVGGYEKGLDYIEPNTSAGSYTDIEWNGEVYGRALRTHNGIKPVFVSVGNNISLDTAVKITLDMVNEESRLPIPTRLADLETHKMRAVLSGNHSFVQ